jgi:hypothetical protein
VSSIRELVDLNRWRRRALEAEKLSRDLADAARALYVGAMTGHPPEAIQAAFDGAKDLLDRAGRTKR